MLTRMRQADVMAKSQDKLVCVLSPKHFLYLESKPLVLIANHTRVVHTHFAVSLLRRF